MSTHPDSGEVDFSSLYDGHPDYVARRIFGSVEQQQIDLEVRLFKLPNMLRVLPTGLPLRRIVEIGCATGELIAAMPVDPGGERIGIDISQANVAAARERFHGVSFFCGDFRTVELSSFDVVILSDVLEHVPDDVDFLRDAAKLGSIILVNLPLEDNWLNCWRPYGPDDVSGHLRRYRLTDALALFERAGLEVINHSRVWVHESSAHTARQKLRRSCTGSTYSGSKATQIGKHLIMTTVNAVPMLGRRLFASNFFAAARSRSFS